MSRPQWALTDHVIERSKLGDIESRLQQITGFMIGIASVHHHAAVAGDVSAYLRSPFHHVGSESPHCANKGIVTRHAPQSHRLGAGGGDHQRAIGQCGVRVIGTSARTPNRLA